MLKRMIVMLAVTAGVIGMLGFVKFRQIQEAMGQAAAFQPPPEAVTTIVAQQEKWPATLSAIGTVAAVQGVTVSADLAGHRRSASRSNPAHRSTKATCSYNSTRSRSRRNWLSSKPG